MIEPHSSQMTILHDAEKIRSTCWITKERILSVRDRASLIDVLNEPNGCTNVEDIYVLSYINMFRASLCPSSGYKCGDVA
jgi:hypothetical protein